MEDSKLKKIRAAAAALFICAAAAGPLRSELGSGLSVSAGKGSEAAVSEMRETASGAAEIPPGLADEAAGDSREEPSSGPAEPRAPEPALQEPERRIDLNSATQAELETLSGIGPARAKAIIEYRKRYGGFVTPEEITEVKGIGEGIYSRIKDDIYVSTGQTGQDQ